MVTFLVCLVVVGGAVVAILWLTMDEGRQPATDAEGASRGTRGDRLATSARRATAYLIPGGSPSGGGRGRRGPPPAARRPTEAARASMTIGSVAMAEAAQARAESESATDGDPVADAEDLPANADTQPVPVTGAGPAPSAPSLAVDPTVTMPWSDDGSPETVDELLDEPAPVVEGPEPEVDPPGAAPGGRPAGRRARPSFGRRLLRRLRGATGLVVLLVALGALLAITLAAVTAMVIIGVRAAVGT